MQIRAGLLLQEEEDLSTRAREKHIQACLEHRLSLTSPS